MKRIFTLCLALMMVSVFTFGEAAQVFGAQTVSGSIGRPDVPEKLSESKKEYMPNAALVMFRTTKKSLSKKQARKALSTGDEGISDLRVKTLWTFREKAGFTSNTSGKRKFLRDGKNGGEYVRVALVTSGSLSTQQLVRKLKKRSDVKYAEPNYKVKALSVSNDAYSDFQWSMQSNEVAPNVAWQWDTKKVTGTDEIVAVVDTGVDYTHPDLKGNMWVNTHYPVLKGEYGFDFSGGDDDPMDENGHGTHCAGIIGAVGNNDIGISGVNQKVRIMALRVLDAEGSAYLAHEIAAYDYIDKALDLGEPVRAINNSWGGGESSDIFADLIDVVGEKGAISVFAAGNDGLDNDVYKGYPCDIDSPYSIIVAASREDGKLVSFSNYGKESVDVAAPGTDILSTVSYPCYNPTLYGSRQNEYSTSFNDYENEGGWSGVDTLKNNMYLNGEKYTGGDGKFSISRQDEGFNVAGRSSSHAIRIEGKGVKAGDLFCMTIPYEISETTEEAPFFSLMCRSEGKPDGAAVFGEVDVPRGTKLDLDTIGDMYFRSGSMIYEDDFDNWLHHTFQTLDEDELMEAKKQARERKEGDLDPMKREIVLLIYTEGNSDLMVELDDMGLSLENPEGGPEHFGKYDFMSGTSMAAPFVTGTVALKAAELGKGTDPETLVNEVVSIAREDGLPVVDGRSLDFRKRPDELSPRIGKITVDQSRNTLTIKGSGLAPSTGTKVEIGDDEDSLKAAKVLSKTDRQVVVQNDGWINNVKTVKVTGYKGKTSIKRDYYLVRGKKTLASKGDNLTSSLGSMTTDGKKIYWTDQNSGCIQKMDPKKADEFSEIYAVPDPKKIFRIRENRNAEYAMQFVSDLVYSNGSLYTVLEFGMCDQREPSEEELWSEEETTDNRAIYSGDFRLIRISPRDGSGVVTNLGKLPSELEKTADVTLAAYNGKLYFIGGFSYKAGSRGITSRVWIYDPAKKKWTKGASLPEGRAGGKALQTGGDLIYTMGYSPAQTGVDLLDQKYPVNLIFNGKKWRKSAVSAAKSIEPYEINHVVNRGGDQYLTAEGDISLMKGGLFYTGMPAVDYGDMFRYQTAKDAFSDSGYNFVNEIGDTELRGLAVGGTYYGFAGEDMYKLSVSSGLISVTANKAKNGTVKGTGSFVPGNTAKVRISANKKYKIRTLKVNGKTVKLKKNQTSYTLTLKNLTSNQKITASFEKK